MNKDIIYIEPEDDITDIISKIENAKQKIVALVPPKKAGVFRSVVNIKLITKAAAAAKKTVVLVTVDPSIVKLAGAAKLAVAKDLKSAPSVPEVKVEGVEAETDDVIEDEVEEDDDEDDKDADEKEEEEEKADDREDEKDAEDDTEDKKEKKPKKKLKALSDNKFVAWIQEHKKIAGFGGAGAVLLIALLVWAFVFAPAVTITVGIKTDINNFSETVSFTTKLEEENADEGRFYLEEKKIETASEVEFEATGKKNVGEKATGSVVVVARFPYNIKGSAVVKSGTQFSISGLNFTSTESVDLVYSGKGRDGCKNTDPTDLLDNGCMISASVPVTANAPGSEYNIEASNSGWTASVAGISVYSDKNMTGGVDKTITIVSQEDIEQAKSEMTSLDEAKSKEELYESIADNMMIIESSFKRTTSDVISTPAVGEEVKEGEKAVAKAITTTSVFVLDKTKVEEFIRAKAKLLDSQKIYEIKSPFIENFTETDGGFNGKLKTSYAVGPKVTENDVIEMTKGKGFGEAQHDLRDIDGIVSVKIDKSYPWVTSVPGNTNKITVILEVKE